MFKESKAKGVSHIPFILSLFNCMLVTPYERLHAIEGDPSGCFSDRLKQEARTIRTTINHMCRSSLLKFTIVEGGPIEDLSLTFIRNAVAHGSVYATHDSRGYAIRPTDSEGYASPKLRSGFGLEHYLCHRRPFFWFVQITKPPLVKRQILAAPTDVIGPFIDDMFSSMWHAFNLDKPKLQLVLK